LVGHFSIVGRATIATAIEWSERGTAVALIAGVGGADWRLVSSTRGQPLTIGS
jgi:hypothetical protein